MSQNKFYSGDHLSERFFPSPYRNASTGPYQNLIQGSRPGRLLISEIEKEFSQGEQEGQEGQEGKESWIVNEEVVVKGLIRSLRVGKKFSFMALSDGSSQTLLQVVFDPGLPEYDAVIKLLSGSSVGVKGKLVKSQGKGQAFEIQATTIDIIGSVDSTYPLQKKATTLEFLREVAHLRPRTQTFGAVFRIRHILSMATHEFFHRRNCLYIHTPIVTGSDCEGAGEVFQVTTQPLDTLDKLPRNPEQPNSLNFKEDYFQRRAYLTVSGQLEGECMALGLGGVYTFGPTFRSENSNTPRHLSEFWMIEPELAFCDFNELQDLARDYIQFLICKVLELAPLELDFFEKEYRPGLKEMLTKVSEKPFQTISYTDAVSLLLDAQQKGTKFEYEVAWGSDLKTEHERYLCEKHFDSPVIVTHYPEKLKSFYMKNSDDGKTVHAMDVLLPGVGEIIGGSEREERYEILHKKMQDKGLDLGNYEWYLDLRRYGSIPHSGFGLGLERMVMYVTGMTNIRDVIPFPRFPGHCEF